eukprot:350618-Chlamydomonas_euryale.AAC.2
MPPHVPHFPHASSVHTPPPPPLQLLIIRCLAPREQQRRLVLRNLLGDLLDQAVCVVIWLATEALPVPAAVLAGVSGLRLATNLAAVVMSPRPGGGEHGGRGRGCEQSSQRAGSSVGIVAGGVARGGGEGPLARHRGARTRQLAQLVPACGSTGDGDHYSSGGHGDGSGELRPRLAWLSDDTSGTAADVLDAGLVYRPYGRRCKIRIKTHAVDLADCRGGSGGSGCGGDLAWLGAFEARVAAAIAKNAVVLRVAASPGCVMISVDAVRRLGGRSGGSLGGSIGMGRKEDKSRPSTP